MQYLLFIISATLMLINECNAAVSYSGYTVFSITPVNADQLDLLLNLREHEENFQVDFWKETVQVNTSADVMVGPLKVPPFKKFLEEEKFKYEVVVDDVQKFIDIERDSDQLQRIAKRSIGSRPNFRTFHTFEEINKYITASASKYNFVSVKNIGKTFEERDMLVAKISTGGTSKPRIWVDGGFHAREWIAPAVVLYIMDQLIQGYNRRDPYVKKLLDRVDFYLLPVANPDGYRYTFQDRMWRKTRSGPHCTGPDRYSRYERCCVGVDLNRNFAYKYGLPSGASYRPCDNDYKGPKAFSEREAENIRKELYDNKRSYDSYITFHSYGQYWFVPYGYDRWAKSYDARELERVAKEGSKALERLYGTKYQVGNGAALLYPSAGTSDDWAKSIGIKWSYCLELRPDESPYSRGFLISTRDILPTCQETWAGLQPIFNKVAGI